MNVIVICEQFGEIRDAFIEAGHNAISCDILPTHSPGPHIQADCRSLDYSRFDLLIANPPCTYLTKAGAGKFWNEHRREQIEALNFVLWIWNLSVERICIENPAGFLTSAWRPPDQYIDPWWFGHREKKHTGLWLKNLPPLIASSSFAQKDRLEFVRTFSGSKSRSILRSRTFPGIARAMALQWGYF
jgi:site-specific DNA-cytosine methylase